MLNGINHITIAVSDLQRSLDFYIDSLGFKGHVKWQLGAYLSLGELWFCLSLDPPEPAGDYSHLAFSVDEDKFAPLRQKLIANNVKQWKENKSEGESFYFLDPDGHKLEIHLGDLCSRLESLKQKPYSGLTWL